MFFFPVIHEAERFLMQNFSFSVCLHQRWTVVVCKRQYLMQQGGYDISGRFHRGHLDSSRRLNASRQLISVSLSLFAI